MRLFELVLQRPENITHNKVFTQTIHPCLFDIIFENGVPKPAIQKLDFFILALYPSRSIYFICIN